MSTKVYVAVSCNNNKEPFCRSIDSKIYIFGSICLLKIQNVSPAVLTVFPGVDVDVAGALTSADVFGSSLVLQ